MYTVYFNFQYQIMEKHILAIFTGSLQVYLIYYILSRFHISLFCRLVGFGSSDV